MSSKFLAELSNDYEKLFETEIGYDVIIYAGEEQNVKEIHAHSNILCARSQYFRTAFSNEWAKKEDGKFILRKQNISPHLFDIILRFLYCGNIELKNLQGPDVLNLLIAVDELNIHSLITYIQEYLIEHQTEFLDQNPTGATIWIAKIKDSTKLIGGYNPLDWNGDGWKNTSDSFLFSFADWKNISNDTTKLSYINSGKHYAIYCNNNYGPQMGDLGCPNFNNWTYSGSLSYYPNSGIPNNITIENYEVFQVIKK
ncbi:unnamed protein product [Rhizophagus irregularis]|nr:unnamed protein product [Rhizophagus irregularis]